MTEQTQKQTDPWQEMAVEKQFKPLVESQEDGQPATLAYLIQETHKYDDQKGELESSTNYLTQALQQNQYAMALMNVLWGGPEVTKPEVAKTLTLESPENLIQEAAVFSRIS